MLIELRCEVGPKELLAKIDSDPDEKDNMTTIMISCSFCTRKNRKSPAPYGERVIHAFDLDGELVDTIHERMKPKDQ